MPETALMSISIDCNTDMVWHFVCNVIGMRYKLQTAAIAFLIFLSTLCGAQNVIQGKVSYSDQRPSTVHGQDVINVVIDTFDGHSLTFGCMVNSVAPCYQFWAGDSVLIFFKPLKSLHIYAGTEALIENGSTSARFWLKRSE